MVVLAALADGGHRGELRLLLLLLEQTKLPQAERLKKLNVLLLGRTLTTRNRMKHRTAAGRIYTGGRDVMRRLLIGRHRVGRL